MRTFYATLATANNSTFGQVITAKNLYDAKIVASKLATKYDCEVLEVREVA